MTKLGVDFSNYHISKGLCGGEEHGVRDVVDAGGDHAETGPREDVRVVPLPRLVPLQIGTN